MIEHVHLPLTLSFQEVEEGWIQVRIEEVPEVVTVGRTRREASLMALDALREYLASFEEGEQVPAFADAWAPVRST